MRYTFLLSLALFLTACNSTAIQNTAPTVTSTNSASEQKEASTEVASSLPTTQQDTDDNDLKIVDETSIVGNYVLQQGMFGTQEITEGYLVIEEIDPDNYGYYYVTIAPKLLPETHTGIFFRKDAHFSQKVIEDSSPSEIAAGKGKSKISIIDNLNLTKEGNRLKLFINSNKKEKLIWKKDVDNITKSTAMIKALNEAKEEYRLYYKEKCQASLHFCVDVEYTKVND